MKATLPVLAVLLAGPALAQQPCDQPRPRDTAPLLKAIQEDDGMASTFDVTAGACTLESAACDAQKLKCGEQLTTTLRSQVTVDNGMWLRDMLIPFLSQRYTPSLNFSTVEVAQDVSCNADSPSLKAAAARRRGLAQRRRDLVNEYPKWAMWAAQTAQKCKTEAAANSKASAEAAATAKAQADAALAAKTAEELRQDNIKKAAQAEKDKIEADKKAKEDAAKAAIETQRKQQEAQVEMQRLQQQQQIERERKEKEARMTEAERQAEAAKRAEEEKKRLAQEAEDKKQREAQALAEAKLVADRESKKSSAEKKADELRAAEEARRLAAEKQIAQAEQVDRSDERLKGSLGAQLQTAYFSLTNVNAGVLLGPMIQARYGIWMTAPADGLASGFEMSVNAAFLGQVAATSGSGGGQMFVVQPDLRWFFARFGVGLSFELRNLVTPLDTTDPKLTYALGLNLAFAIVDSIAGRVILVFRWLPFLNNGVVFGPERITAEAQFGYQWFFASLQTGTVTLRNGNSTLIGWYAGAGIGGRLRF